MLYGFIGYYGVLTLNIDDMKLEMIKGCICDSLTIDDVEEINLTDEKRIEVLVKIGKYVASCDIHKIGEVLSDELEMVNTEEDLEYADDFYLSLIDKEIIQPLQQFPKEWNHEAEHLARQFRSYLSKYIRDLHPNCLNTLLQTFIEEFGVYEGSVGPCECCGDYIETFTLEI